MGFLRPAWYTGDRRHGFVIVEQKIMEYNKIITKNLPDPVSSPLVAFFVEMCFQNFSLNKNCQGKNNAQTTPIFEKDSTRY